MKKLFVVFVLVFWCVASVSAQSPASNKAFFVAGTNDLTLAQVVGGANEAYTMTLLDAPNALKTSSNGAIEAAVSLECALWTYTPVSATMGGGKNVVSSRAGIKVWVEVDGVPATPGQVVYCDRLQVVGLEVSCAGTCDDNTQVTLDLFQATKSANSFHFFAGPLSPTIHNVVVKGQGVIECRADGTEVNPCPENLLKEYWDAKTMAVVGKRTVALTEHNNWGTP